MSRLARILKAPWLATIRSAYGYLFLCVWFMLSIDISAALPLHGKGVRLGVALLMLAVAVAWKLVVNTLWLVRDAQTLCLPGIGRDADTVPPLAASLTVLLPALLLGAAFGHLLLWLVSLALVAVLTLTFLLSPVVLALPIFLLAITLALFGIHPPLPGNAGYLHWAAPITALLAVVAVQRWIALRRATTLAESYWWRPASSGGRLVQLRRLGGSAYVPHFAGAAQPTRKARPDGMPNVGPGHSIRSLRVALHAALMPLDTRVRADRYWLWQASFAIAVLVPPVAALLTARRLGIGPVLMFSPQFLLFSAILLTVTSASDRATGSVWCKPGGGLALLGLLPNLAPRARIHRDTLLACVATNLHVKAWLAFSAVMLFAVLHLPVMFYAYLGLMLATGTAMQFATTIAGVCGRRRRVFGGYVMYAVAMVPTILTAIWGVRVVDPAQPRFEIAAWPTAACVLLWLACCAAFATLAWHDWHRFAARPHPFLANP